MSETGAMSWKRKGKYLKEKPVPEEPKKGRNHKDTKKWCKGVKGREHEYEWKLTNKFPPDWGWYDLACKKCGKHKDYCTKPLWGNFSCKCGHHKETK